MVDQETRRAQIRNCQKKRRIKARQEGLCTICCKVKVVPGRVTCDKCMKYIMDARKKHDMV